MPIIAAGTMIFNTSRSRQCRQIHRLTPSIINRIGSRTAAASTGGMTSDITGTPISAKAPPNPPFDSPTNATARSVTHNIVGVAKTVQSTRLIRKLPLAWRGHAPAPLPWQGAAARCGAPSGRASGRRSGQGEAKGRGARPAPGNGLRGSRRSRP